MLKQNLQARLARSRRSGFTLIEIMIVVLIIGILLAIAVPNFVRAREQSRAKSCSSNLKQIDSGKEQWAMDTRASQGDAGPAIDGVLFAADGSGYLKSLPECPAGGVYTVGNIGVDPTCDGSPDPALYPHTVNGQPL